MLVAPKYLEIAHPESPGISCDEVSSPASQRACHVNGSVLSKTAIFPRGKETWEIQRICTGFVAPRGQRIGERQRRTAWWARHSKDTANNHLVQKCLYYANNALASRRDEPRADSLEISRLSCLEKMVNFGHDLSSVPAIWQIRRYSVTTYFNL